jgi:hypothetical protein
MASNLVLSLCMTMLLVTAPTVSGASTLTVEGGAGWELTFHEPVITGGRINTTKLHEEDRLQMLSDPLAITCLFFICIEQGCAKHIFSPEQYFGHGAWAQPVARPYAFSSDGGATWNQSGCPARCHDDPRRPALYYLPNASAPPFLNDSVQTKVLNYLDGSGVMNHLWYDDPETYATKYVAIKKTSVRGIGMWTADCAGNNACVVASLWASVPAPKRASSPLLPKKTDDDGFGHPATLIDHPIAGPAAPIYLDGADWVATHKPGPSGPQPVRSADCGFASDLPVLDNYSSWRGWLPANRANTTGSHVCSVDACGQICSSQGESCVGFTATEKQIGAGDPVLATQCWTYGRVSSLVIGSTSVTYYSKRALPIPPHPPSPPPPPPLARVMNATVPGDVISDLQRAGIVGDPYFDTNWTEPRFVEAWNSGIWTYTKTFERPQTAGDAGGSVLLVLDGVRMGAMVFVNGVFIGNTTNAYRRYVFALDAHSLSGHNELAIRFGAELGINTEGRYTHSQQIDWAPAMPTTDPLSGQRPPWGPRATFGFAIWKSVYLVPLSSTVAAITHLVPHTYYAGGHPTSFLTTKSHAGFEVQAAVELYCPGAKRCAGTVSFVGSWPNNTAVSSGMITVPAGQYLTVNLTVPHTETKGVQLWHPRGNGGQPRYNVTATFASTSSPAASAASRQMGFRHVALVTLNDTDPAVLASVKANGTTHTGAFTFLWRVNGAPVYARGGAKIPMDLLEGRFSANAHRRLVLSAAEGNFNLIRLWGGSIYEPAAFYDAADEFGILLYHDLQYNRDEGDLGNTTDQRQEISHQIRRLSHHPSIVCWNGGNEMYAPLQPDLDVILTQVALHDKSRPIWPASPGSGWLSGIDPLSSRPCGARNPGQGAADGEVLCGETFTDNGVFPPLRAIPNSNADLPPGLPFSRPPGQPYPFEYHGPYYDGTTPSEQVMPTSWPAREVNGGAEGPGTRPVPTGPGFPGWFTAEFGCTVWQSFESMSGTLSADNWGYPAPATAGGQRNHALFANLFPPLDVVIGEQVFEKMLYRSMINQMLTMKVLIEAFRSQNVWGTSFVSADTYSRACRSMLSSFVSQPPLARLEF